MVDQKYLMASDGTGAAVLAHVSVNRLAGATTLQVDNVDNWPPFFIATSGKLDPNGYITEATKREFRGHLQSGQIIIDGFEPGFTDGGNTTDQVVIIKQTVSWADGVVGRLVPAGLVSPFAGTAAPLDWLLCDGASLLRADYPELFVVIGSTYGAVDGAHFNLPDLRSRVPVGAGAAATKVAKVVSRSGNVLTLSGIDDTNSNEFQTGTPVVYNVTGTTIGGLTNGTTYYIRRTGNKTISLSTSQSNAVNGSVITLSSDGAGDRKFTLSLTARPLGETGGEERHSLITAEQAAHTHSPASGAGNWIHNQLNNPGVSQYNGGNGQLGASGMSSSGGNQDHNIMQPFTVLNYIIKT